MAQLFANFEINKEPKWPILLRLIVGSVVLHLGLVWMVVYVPAFRDALNIAALIANTKFVDKAYNRTQIGDEIDFVQLTNEKFHYPEGYFAIDNREPSITTTGFISGSDPYASKIISRASDAKDVNPEASPSASPNASPSPSPTGSPSSSVASASPSPAGEKKMSVDEAQEKLEKTAADNNLTLPAETELNKQVLKDFAKYANDLKEQGKLDLNQPFEVVIEAELDQKGKLLNPRFTKKAGDPNLVDVFARMVAALNDSGFLVYLQPISKDNPNATVIFTIKQGQSEVEASVASETSSPASARVLAKALNAALVFGASSRAGKDEEVLMKNTNVTPDGKKVLVNFSMPRQTVVDMIKKQLEPGV